MATIFYCIETIQNVEQKQGVNRDVLSRSGGYSLHADSNKIKLNNRFIEELSDRELERISLINYEDRSDEERAYVKARSYVKKGEFISSDFNCVKIFHSIYPKSTEKYILVKYNK